MFKAILNFLSTPWGVLIGWILGIITAIIVYYKQKKEKTPVYGRQTFPLIIKTGQTPKKFEIRYDGQIIDNISLTKFSFWNAGKETIKQGDITSADPLVIKSKQNATIYDFEITYSDNVNNFQIIKLDDHTLKVTFDFIDLNQGIVLNIYHNGITSDDIYCSGTFIGGNLLRAGAISPNFLLQKLDFISKPVNNFTSSKSIFKKIIGWAFFAPLTVLISLPLFILVAPASYVYMKASNVGPQRFLLKDD